MYTASIDKIATYFCIRSHDFHLKYWKCRLLNEVTPDVACFFFFFSPKPQLSEVSNSGASKTSLFMKNKNHRVVWVESDF